MAWISGLSPAGVSPASLFANVVGFLNAERQPQAGLEQAVMLILPAMSRPDTSAVEPMAPHCRPISLLEPSVSDDLRLQLTLDSRLQQVALTALAEQVAKWKAQKGAAIVMDATNGELLVLASTPTYDPNRYWISPPGDFVNGLFRISTSRARRSSQSILRWHFRTVPSSQPIG